MSYLTIAPLVLVRVPDEVGDGYRVDYHYAGSVIPKLTDEQAERFVRLEYVEPIGDQPSADDGPPKHAAPKAAWVDFAISKGADPDEAEATAKADLIAQYGGE